MTAAPNSKNAANALNTSWMRDDQLSGDLTDWFDPCDVDIMKTIFPEAGWKFQLLGRNRLFLLDGHTKDLIAWGKIGAL